MAGGIEGERPRELTPEQKQNSPEAGAGPLGIPSPGQDQSQQDHPECQVLPDAWDILEREIRLYDPALPQPTAEEYSREIEEISRLQVEMDEKGSTRDNLIHKLYWDTVSFINCPPGSSPFDLKHLTLSEFQQFRSQVRPLSGEEIRVKIHQLAEERERQWEEYRSRHKNDPPSTVYH